MSTAPDTLVKSAAGEQERYTARCSSEEQGDFGATVNVLPILTLHETGSMGHSRPRYDRIDEGSASGFHSILRR